MSFPKFSVNLDLEKFTKFTYPNPVIGCCQGTFSIFKSCKIFVIFEICRFRDFTENRN